MLMRALAPNVGTFFLRSSQYQPSFRGLEFCSFFFFMLYLIVFLQNDFFDVINLHSPFTLFSYNSWYFSLLTTVTLVACISLSPYIIGSYQTHYSIKIQDDFQLYMQKNPRGSFVRAIIITR